MLSQKALDDRDFAFDCVHGAAAVAAVNSSFSFSSSDVYFSVNMSKFVCNCLVFILGGG